MAVLREKIFRKLEDEWLRVYMGVMEKYTRNCPQCGCEMIYKTQDGRRQGIKSNSVCQICQGLNCRKHNLDPYFNKDKQIWEKPCPQCEKIIEYPKRKDIIRSLNRHLICKPCAVLNKVIDYTTHHSYNFITKTWTRLCPQCNEIIHYARFRSWRTGDRNNFVCMSCAMTEVSNRPEIRANSSRTMKKILTTACSKKELELFELIKHLGFTHNDEANLINIEGYFPDMVHSTYKLLVEFYGDRYHANPRDKRFGAEDAQIKIGREIKLAKDIRDRDAKRKKILEDAGYKVIIIWEDMFNPIKNRQIIVQKIENILNNYSQLNCA